MKNDENTEWLKKRKELIKNIKNFEAKKDRIKTATQISYMHNAIYESILGWQNWITGWISIELTKNIKIKDPSGGLQLTDAELKELHDKFKEFATAFLSLDIRYTEIINEKLSKKRLQFSGILPESNAYKGMVV